MRSPLIRFLHSGQGCSAQPGVPSFRPGMRWLTFDSFIQVRDALGHLRFPHSDWGCFGLTWDSLIQAKVRSRPGILSSRPRCARSPGIPSSRPRCDRQQGIPISRPTVLRATWDSNIQTHGAIATHRFPHSAFGAIGNRGIPSVLRVASLRL